MSGDLAEAETHVRDALSGTVVLGALAAALVAALVAAPIALRIVRPLRRVTVAAQLLGNGDATPRAGEHNAPGEIGTLKRAFDAMAERLEANDVARRNLAADVAHELRTPLTLLHGGCEEIIDGITEPTVEHFVQMNDDVLRLRRLVDDLGTLAEADAVLAGPNIAVERCDLAEIAAQAADALTPLAEANQQQVNRSLKPALVDGDPRGPAISARPAVAPVEDLEWRPTVQSVGFGGCQRWCPFPCTFLEVDDLHRRTGGTRDHVSAASPRPQPTSSNR